MVENLKRFRRSHIVVRAGKPIHVRLDESLGRDAALQAAADDIMCRIALMLPERYRGVYADHPRLEQIRKSEAVPLHPQPKPVEVA